MDQTTVVMAFEKIIGQRRFLPATRFMLRVISAFNSLSFKWSPKEQKFSKNSLEPLGWILYAFNLLCVTLDFIFISGRVIQVFWNNWPVTNSPKLGEVILLLTLLGPKIFALIFTYQPLLQREDVINLTNEMLRLRKSVGLWDDIRGTKIYAMLSFLRFIQMVFVGIMKPNRKQFWYSALDSSWKTPFIYYLHVLYAIQTSVSFTLTLLFGVNNLLGYANTIANILRMPVNGRASLDAKLYSYRAMQVLANTFEDVYGMILETLRMYCLMILSMLAFGSVRLYESLDFRVYLNVPITFFIISAFAFFCFNSLSVQVGLSQKAIRLRFGVAQEPYLGNGTSLLPKRVSLHKGKVRKFDLRRVKAYRGSCKPISCLGFKRSLMAMMLKFVIFQSTRLLVVIGPSN